ncbi:Nonsense-mediated mRNA decay protein 5 [Malassezia sp. CBS 17886]|nr:Nonsense-mediated mRNA decay protein 5 [Malassezia sp. CBS 17886]
MDALLRLFPATLSADINVRRTSELELRRLESAPGMLAASFQMVASDDVDMAVRQAAAIYVKNRIARAWDAAPTRTDTSRVPDEDRGAVRSVLLSTIAAVPPSLRVHVTSSLYVVARCDYPEAWPTLLDDIVALLASAQEAQVYAGVRALVEAVRSFRFADSGAKLEEVVARTFPQLLATTTALLDSPQSQLPEVGEIVYYALKAYKTSMVITLTQHQQMQESIVPWGTLFLRVAQKPLDDAALADDAEAREKTSWWKAKKWAFYSLNKLFSRYGIPTQLPPSMKSYRPFAETFLASFAPEILKAYLHICEGVIQGQWVSRPVARSLLLFFHECVKPKSIWMLLRPHMAQLTESFVYPRLCFNDEDAELWELDPVDFVRAALDPLEEIGTPASAAALLLNTVVSKRTKSMFEPTLHFITSILSAYPAHATARQFDGALRMCVTICQTMVTHDGVQDKLDAFLTQHVIPTLSSPDGFLRRRACSVVQAFDAAGMKWHSGQTLEAAFRGVMDCIVDPELPVRVQAAEAVGELVAHDEVHAAMAPNAGRLMQELLKLSDETDLDVLMTTQEKVVSHFAEELLPFSVQLVEQMARSYLRLVQENLAGTAEMPDPQSAQLDQNEEDKYFAALGCLSTMYQMVTTAESRPEILAELEHVLLPVVAYTMETETIDLYDDCFQLTDVLTYYQKRISPGMWNIFTLMHKSFKGAGIDYLSEMIGTLDNCASYGTQVLQENAEYRGMLLDIFNTAMASDQLGVSDRIAACQLGEVILLLLRGCVDDAMPGMMALLLPYLRRDAGSSFNLRKWVVLVLLEALYYSPTMALQVLETNGATSEFFSVALPLLPKFRRVHECKVAAVALLSVLSLSPDAVPASVRVGFPHLLAGLIVLLRRIPLLVTQRREVQKALDEGFDEEDENSDEGEAGEEFDDDADVQDDDNEYLELLAEEAARLRTKVANLEGGAVDDDEDDEEELDDEDLVYESPLENVPVYGPFRVVMNQLQTQHADVFQTLTAGLSEEQQSQLREVCALQDSEETGTSAPPSAA